MKFFRKLLWATSPFGVSYLFHSASTDQHTWQVAVAALFAAMGAVASFVVITEAILKEN